jgi:hypothetical protein
MDQPRVRLLPRSSTSFLFEPIPEAFVKRRRVQSRRCLGCEQIQDFEIKWFEAGFLLE